MYIYVTESQYMQLGWSVVPIPHRSKFPVIPWAEFQKLPASADQVERWVAEGTGLGVVCGEVSQGLVCLDFDDRFAYESWAAQNPISQTLPTAQSQRGFHVFYRAKRYQPSAKLHFMGPSVGDVLSNGKLVVLPPTLHPSGTPRKWIRTPYDNLPFHDLNELGLECRAMEKIEPVNGVVEQGNRHSYMLKEAVKLSRTGMPMTDAMAKLSNINDTFCSPQIERQELGNILAWAFGKEIPESRSQSHRNGNGSNEQSLITPKPHSQENDSWEQYFTPVEEYLSGEEDLELDWVVENFIPKSFLIVLGGTSKAGKSCFVTAMAHAIAQGEPFMGMNTERSGVLWCCFEESKVERGMALNAFGGPEAFPGLAISHMLPPIDTPEGIKCISNAIEQFNPSLVVIDPLYGAHSQESLSGGTSGRNCLVGLKNLCATKNVAAIVIHHFTKNVGAGLTRERMADSGQILAAASMDVLMNAKDTEEGHRLIRMKGKGRGGFANFDWKVLSKSVTEFELLETGSGSGNDPGAVAAVLGCLKNALAALSASEIQSKTGIPLQTVRNTLTTLKNRAKVICERHAREFYYSLPE